MGLSLQSLGGELLELLYPTRCCFCRRLTGKGRPVCRACLARYPDVPASFQRQTLKGLRGCVSPLWYAGAAREALLRFPTEADAEAMLDYLRITAGETDFLLRYPEECDKRYSLEAEKRIIERIVASETDS